MVLVVARGQEEHLVVIQFGTLIPLLVAALVLVVGMGVKAHIVEVPAVAAAVVAQVAVKQVLVERLAKETLVVMDRPRLVTPEEAAAVKLLVVVLRVLAVLEEIGKV